MYCRFQAYKVRNYLAVLDHNQHIDRPLALTKDGNIRQVKQSYRIWHPLESFICLKNTPQMLSVQQLYKYELLSHSFSLNVKL